MAQRGTISTLDNIIKDFEGLYLEQKINVLKVALANQKRFPSESNDHCIAISLGWRLKGNGVYFRED